MVMKGIFHGVKNPLGKMVIISEYQSSGDPAFNVYSSIALFPKIDYLNLTSLSLLKCDGSLEKSVMSILDDACEKLTELGVLYMEEKMSEDNPEDDPEDDEWFEEYCWHCDEVKTVHHDMSTNLGDPGFICKDCERKILEMEEDMNKQWKKEMDMEGG